MEMETKMDRYRRNFNSTHLNEFISILAKKTYKVETLRQSL